MLIFRVFYSFITIHYIYSLRSSVIDLLCDPLITRLQKVDFITGSPSPIREKYPASRVPPRWANPGPRSTENRATSVRSSLFPPLSSPRVYIWVHGQWGKGEVMDTIPHCTERKDDRTPVPARSRQRSGIEEGGFAAAQRHHRGADPSARDVTPPSASVGSFPSSEPHVDRHIHPVGEARGHLQCSLVSE